jgi:NADPH-dependent curcumin reductase CurA
MRCVLLAAVPEGMPKESDFRIEETRTPECPPNGLVVRTQWISVDPYLRGRMTGNRTYIDPIPVGQPMESGAVGEVVESQSPGFQSGDVVSGMWAWQEYAAVDAARVLKLDPAEAPVSTALGILGMPGMTAYFGLTQLCEPQAGETVFVSGAAGAVGSAVGQIAKILGCRVVGSAGSDEKVAFVKALGFDEVFNYKTAKPYAETLKSLCPNGIDCYFDNVGGELTDAVLQALNVYARVAVCGQISQYNNRAGDVGPRPYWPLIMKQIRMEGFLVTRWSDRWPEGRKQMAQWLKEGKLRYEETVFDGLESAPRAFIGLFTGENTGKALVRV